MQNCQDTFSATFASFNELFGYQQQVSSAASGAIAQPISSTWSR